MSWVGISCCLVGPVDSDRLPGKAMQCNSVPRVGVVFSPFGSPLLDKRNEGITQINICTPAASAARKHNKLPQ